MASTGVTEFALFPLKAGLNVHDDNDPSNRLFRDALKTVLAQPGSQRAVFSAEVENPTNLRLFVDWDKVEDHIDFTKRDVYGPMLKELEPLFASKPTIKHVAVKPFPARVLSANSSAIEVFGGYFPYNVSQQEQNDYANRWTQFAEKALSKSTDVTGIAQGWSLETDVPNPETGEASKAFIVFIGWTSVEAHMAFREHEAFKEHAPLIRKGPAKLEVFHIKPEELQAGLA